MRILNLRSRAAKVVGTIMVLAAIALPVSQMAFAADTPDCNSNAVTYGGASTSCSAANYSKANLVAKIQNGDGQHSASNLQAIYNGFLGTNTSQLVTDINNAQLGSVTKSGNVVVNGKTVASGVWTAGRTQLNPNDQQMFGVWMRVPAESFLSDSLSAYVIMNGNQFVGAILLSCGNPVYHVNHPHGLIFKRVVSTSGSNVDADTQATAVNEPMGGTFQYQIQVLNDGNTSMDNTVVTDTLPAGVTLANGSGQNINVNLGSIAAGSNKTVTVNAKVTATSATCINNVSSFTANDNQKGTNNAWICVTNNNTPTPSPTQTPNVNSSFVCTGLVATPVGDKTTTLEYKFTASSHEQNAIVQSYTFTFKDSNGNTVATQTVKTSATSATIDYKFPKMGTYTASAVVKTDKGTTDVGTCQTTLQVAPGNHQCVEGQTDVNGVCVTNHQCVSGQILVNGICVTETTQTTNLPQTGADGLAGLAGMGGMGYAARAYLRSKRNLRDTLRRK